MNNPTHPIYALARFVVMALLLAFALWLFANDFDETEVKSMGTFAAMILGALGIERLGNIKERLTGKVRQ